MINTITGKHRLLHPRTLHVRRLDRVEGAHLFRAHVSRQVLHRDMARALPYIHPGTRQQQQQQWRHWGHAQCQVHGGLQATGYPEDCVAANTHIFFFFFLFFEIPRSPHHRRCCSFQRSIGKVFGGEGRRSRRRRSTPIPTRIPSSTHCYHHNPVPAPAPLPLPLHNPRPRHGRPRRSRIPDCIRGRERGHFLLCNNIERERAVSDYHVGGHAMYDCWSGGRGLAGQEGQEVGGGCGGGGERG